MNVLKGLIYFVIVAAIAGSSAMVGYMVARSGPKAPMAVSADDEKGSEAVAKVHVVRARVGPIERTVTAFGTVVASPEDVQTVSVPFESRVRRVLALAGQAVAPGTNLIAVEPSPDTQLALADARSSAEAARKELTQVQQRIELKLATRSELVTAQQTLDLAQSKLQNLEKRGIEAKQLSANLNGLVSKVDVQEGQIVPAGGVLVEVVPADRIQVRLGVEPSQVGLLKVGQVVHVARVQDEAAAPVQGTVKMVTQRIDPATRLVDVLVALPAKSLLVLDTFVRARIVVQTKTALLVPPSAVLPEEDKNVLWTVAEDKAIEHEVEVGLRDDNNLELTGGDVKAGDAVVVQGNAELEKGMAVEVEGEHEAQSHPSQTAATSPAGKAGQKESD